MTDWIDVLSAFVRSFFTLVVFVATLWRLALYKSVYFGWLRPSNFIRVWIAAAELGLIYGFSPPAISCWLVAICLDLVLTHRVSDRLWVYTVCSMLASMLCWIAWLENPKCFGLAWAFNVVVVCLASVALLFVWPFLQAPRHYRDHAPRPQSSKVFCVVYVLLACLSFVFSCAASFRLLQLVTSIGTIAVYEWFYTWQYAAVTVSKVFARDFDFATD